MENPIQRVDKRRPQEDELRDRAEALFVQYLFQDQRLNLEQRIKELNQEFPDVAQETNILELYYAGKCGYSWGGISTETAREYCARLMQGIPKCLLPDGGVQWLMIRLHQRVMTAGFPDFPEFWVSTLEKRIAHLKLDLQLERPIYPQTRKSDVEEWAFQELRRLVRDEWKKIEAMPRYRQRLRGISSDQLPRDVEWLYLRVFRGHTGATMPVAYTREAIDLMIRRTARILGIRLPRGRIPKAEKR